MLEQGKRRGKGSRRSSRLPKDFAGRIEIENRYNFTNARQCSFNWELVTFRRPEDKQPGHTVDHRGSVTAPSISPGTNPKFHRGWLELDLPGDWKQSDALRLTATDPHGKDILTWTWVTSTAAERRETIVQPGEGKVTASEADGKIVLAAADVEVVFDTSDGSLSHILKNGKKISLGNGPSVIAGEQELEKIQHFPEGDNYVVLVRYAGKSYGGRMRSAQWTLMPSGWLKLDYHYFPMGAQAFFGISFDYPESKVKSMTWLGRGPFRVWKNRLVGPTWGVWNKHYNQTATGHTESVDPYDYPEFKGYHADVRWVVLHTEEGDLTFVSDNESLFFRNFSADYAKAEDNVGTDPRFPKSDLSFMDAIPPQGNKIGKPVDAPGMGPQGSRTRLDGDIYRTIYLKF